MHQVVNKQLYQHSQYRKKNWLSTYLIFVSYNNIISLLNHTSFLIYFSTHNSQKIYLTYIFTTSSILFNLSFFFILLHLVLLVLDLVMSFFVAFRLSYFFILSYAYYVKPCFKFCFVFVYFLHETFQNVYLLLLTSLFRHKY